MANSFEQLSVPLFRSPIWRAVMGCLSLGFVAALLLTGCETAEIGDEPVAVELRELPPGVGDAYRRLTGSSLGLAERTGAATTLIEIDDFAADRALAAALGREQPELVWRAVLQAVSIHPGDPPRGLWRPMLAMLYHVSPEMVPDVATAMGRYDDAALLERLRDTALNTGLPTRERGRAVAALGQWRTRSVAEDLIGLTALTEASDVQSSAYAALQDLTGIERFGKDRRAWNEWWADARRLDALAWQEQLVANFARRAAVRRATDQQLAAKLREAQRDLYLATSPRDQPAALAGMLDQPLLASRLLALDLAQARLVGGQGFSEPLREALRQRLDDGSAEVRWRSAELLRDLLDEPAADLVAQKLMAGDEQVARVSSAYLGLLTQMPRKTPTDAITALLDESGLRADACGALAEVARKGLLTPRRADVILDKLRGYLEAGQRPSPQMVKLLGQVGRNDEWRRIEAWIDDRDDVIRQAAAQAWADAPDRSLEILAERADDEIIRPIAIRAATDRGQNPETLRKLADNPPGDPQLLDAWERALIAMAARPTISPERALQTAKFLLDQPNNRPQFVDRFLTAAIDRHGPAPAKDDAYLLLRLARAENRMAMGEADLAINDYEFLLGRTPDALTARQRDDLYRGLIPAYLRARRYDPAIAAARAFFEDPAQPGRLDASALEDPLMQTFLDTIRADAELERFDEANDLFEKFMLLLGPERDRRLPISLTPQINNIRKLLDAAAAAQP